VRIAVTNISWPFHASVGIFVHPWPRPVFLWQLQGIIFLPKELNLYFKVEFVAPGQACHQKRVVEFGEWLCQELVKAVPHRHVVLSIPEILRRYFLYDRKR
jgi:hypothetical protein